jgi:hypothetical protein
VAAAITSEQMNLGNEFLGMEFGFTDEPTLRRLQGQTGMDYNTLLTMASQDPGQFFQTLMPQLQAEAARFFKSPAAYQQAQQIISEGFAAGRDVTTITRQVLPLLIDLSALQQILGQFGVRVSDPFQAALYVVAMVGGQINPQERIAQQQQEVQVQNIQGEGEIPAREEWLKENYLQKGGFFGTGIFGNARHIDLNKALRRHVSRTGQIEGLVGKLYEDGWADSIQQVIIQTQDGPKVMDLAEAVGNYGDQINAGNAVIVGGDQGGMTIAEAVGGGHADPTAASGTPVDVGRGESADSYFRREGSVTLGLTPEARRVLQPTAMSGVSWDDYYVQPDQHQTQDSYASGNP